MAQYHEHTYSVQSSDPVVVKVGKHLRGFFWAGAEDPYYTGKLNARQLSAMLKTDEERETRTRLAQALNVANALQVQVCGGNDGEEARPSSSDKTAERSRSDTIHITLTRIISSNWNSTAIRSTAAPSSLLDRAMTGSRPSTRAA